MTGDRRASERASGASRDLASRDMFPLTTPRNLSTSFGAGAGELILRRQLDGGRGWFTNSPLRAETPHAHGFSRTPWSVVRGSMRAQPRAATNLENQIRPRQSLTRSVRVVHQPKQDALARSARGGPPATLLPVHMLRVLTAAWGQHSTCPCSAGATCS